MRSNTQQEALYELLVHEHAEDYAGTDDMMIEACDDWISGLSEDEVADICIKAYQKGI